MLMDKFRTGINCFCESGRLWL